ncbi:hypothetical protein K1T71_013842 [Dendrolimus kikuchii]|uniref:Uncharacterized protein n=1 Tax=Dendrolimus kikuchii TaxID=765133 RepID=A0ACC1CFX4_9NEOP|nr:hypothetical protein K1T71_013842 [Dendrolimus kikuchii]
MSSKSDLEGEEFDEVTLVRMEDIQPSRANQVVVKYVKALSDENETCAEDSYYIDYLHDDDSNIGSMVSIKSETVPIEHNYSERYVIPDSYVNIPSVTEKPEVKILPADSWPTLEILPGGVIRHAEKPDEHTLTNDSLDDSTLDKLYACAICSDSYRDLYSLVKHVKSHENEKKMEDHIKVEKNKGDKAARCNGTTSCLVTKKRSLPGNTWQGLIRF